MARPCGPGRCRASRGMSSCVDVGGVLEGWVTQCKRLGLGSGYAEGLEAGSESRAGTAPVPWCRLLRARSPCDPIDLNCGVGGGPCPAKESGGQARCESAMLGSRMAPPCVHPVAGPLKAFGPSYQRRADHNVWSHQRATLPPGARGLWPRSEPQSGHPRGIADWIFIMGQEGGRQPCPVQMYPN